MNYFVVGTCSLCGGPVTLPRDWACVIPAVPTCGQCGATQASHGPVIEMQPSKPFQFDRNGTKIYRSYADYVDD